MIAERNSRVYQSPKAEASFAPTHFDIQSRITTCQAYQDEVKRSLYEIVSRPELFSPLSYPDVYPTLPWSDLPKSDTSQSVSVSDLEESKELTPDLLAGSMRGISGHMITTLYYSALSDLGQNQRLGHYWKNIKDLAPHETEILARIAESKAKFDGPIDCLPDYMYEIWKELRTHYCFYHQIPNSKMALVEGERFNARTIEDMWNSCDETNFENRLFGIHASELKSYLSRSIMESGDEAFPLEAVWTAEPIHEVPERKMIEISEGTGFQLKGQMDTLYELGPLKVIIDQKFGSPQKLFSDSARMQSLAYSILSHGKAPIMFNQVSAQNTIMVLHVFDTQSGVSYYVDATVYPEEFPSVAENFEARLYHLRKNRESHKEQKMINKRAAVMPHLPNYPEQTKDSQQRLFVI